MDRAGTLVALRSAVTAVTASVDAGWRRHADPSTMACGSLADLPGRRWVDDAEGAFDGGGGSVDAETLEEVAAAARRAFAEGGLDPAVRRLGSPTDVIEIVGGRPDGLRIVLTLSGDGAARLRGQSACFDA